MFPGLLAILLALAQPAAPASFRVPYHLGATNHILLRARINGHGPFNFIMDTGAPAVFLSTPDAAECGVKPDAGHWGALQTVEVEGGPVLTNLKARIEEPSQLLGMNAMNLLDEHLDGVLGYNLLSQFRIEFDATDPYMTWTHVPYTPEIPPDAQSIADKLASSTDPAIRQATHGMKQMQGMAGMMAALFGSKPPATVGHGLLGILLKATGPAEAASCLPGSPAAAAGVKAGDRIVKVVAPGEPPQSVDSATSVWRALHDVGPGDTVVLVLLRGGKRMKLALRAVAGGM